MTRRIYIFGPILIGLIAAALLPISVLKPGLQLIGTALSIQIAAVFVRLNRGMPTVTWNRLEQEESERLTQAFVDLTREYIAIITANGINLIFALGLIMADQHLTELTVWGGRLLVGLFVIIFAFNVMRIGYVIWRDYDIVKLQKAILDLSLRREAANAARKEAETIIANIGSAGLTGNKTSPPKSWTEH